jgi:polyphenol oxidase
MNVVSGNTRRDKTGAKNRKRFLDMQGLDGRVCLPRLRHGNNVVVVGEENWHQRHEADGFLTKDPGLVLTVTVADCIPVYLHDPVRKVVGLVHAGWRGIVLGVVEKTIGEMKEVFGSCPKDVSLCIGPGICKEHFSIRGDVLCFFEEWRSFVQKGRGEHHVDIAGILAKQARLLGVRTIEDCGLCTFCDERFYSSRREQQKPPNVMLAYICMDGV